MNSRDVGVYNNQACRSVERHKTTTLHFQRGAYIVAATTNAYAVLRPFWKGLGVNRDGRGMDGYENLWMVEGVLGVLLCWGHLQSIIEHCRALQRRKYFTITNPQTI